MIYENHFMNDFLTNNTDINDAIIFVLFKYLSLWLWIISMGSVLQNSIKRYARSYIRKLRIEFLENWKIETFWDNPWLVSWPVFN